MRILILLLAAALLMACAPAQPFYLQRVNATLWRSSQPRTEAEWRAVRAAIGPGGVVVKLNDAAEGSDDGAAAAGLQVVPLAIDPRGDGPIYAQAESVFRKPDASRVGDAVALACDPHVGVLVHCSHGWDRTGLVVAEERVLCEGWSLGAAHDEWHREAHYVPHGVRIPAPGLEAAWGDFAARMRAMDRLAADLAAAALVRGALGLPAPAVQP